ncbi:MAG: prepilin-type N-terminal cleavage/methylation domain-containing protein [Gemmatimonadota bacterium]|nr:MAG: prepilin-type N-terminal cleavage/methylation domain-containing protein [Gemmatimonadota bacterium]
MRAVKGESGFTITELLISVVIIAIGVVGFASAVGLASTELWMGGRDTEVSLLLIEHAEKLKATPYDSVQTDSTTSGPYTLKWEVQGGNPKRVVLSATIPLKEAGATADTVVIYVPR